MTGLPVLSRFIFRTSPTNHISHFPTATGHRCLPSNQTDDPEKGPVRCSSQEVQDPSGRRVLLRLENAFRWRQDDRFRAGLRLAGPGQEVRATAQTREAGSVHQDHDLEKAAQGA